MNWILKCDRLYMNWILKRDRLSSFLNQKKAIAPFLINKKSDRLFQFLKKAITLFPIEINSDRPLLWR